MLESCQNAQERWGGLHLMIDRWLQERQQLVRAFKALNADKHAPAANANDLQGFCEVLVDYVSAGHFEIYEQLMQEAALAFNDHCDNGDARDSQSLHAELEQLGGLLQERFELEDCLIEVLHNAHQQAPAQPA